MVTNFHLPPTGYGPGSQPEEGDELSYTQMPQNMRTFSAHVPDVQEAARLEPAFALLAAIADAAERAGNGGAPESFPLAELDAENRQLIAETMGEGEVAIKVHGLPAVRAQESVFAGIWVLSGIGVDEIEVAPAPTLAQARAFEPLRPAVTQKQIPGVANAPALLFELQDKAADWTPGAEAHVINLSLLPHTEADLVWLEKSLGQGSTDILSRGYGNCRVTATALSQVWKVQFYNSTDQLILDTYEVTDIPDVVVAAAEDLSDSATRLREVLEAMR